MSRQLPVEGEGDALEQAAEWFAELQDERVTARQQERWRRWLRASEAHRQAWARVERIDRQFQQIPSRPARQALASAGGRRRFLQGLGALVVAAPLGWGAWRSRPAEAWRADLRTAIGEVRALELPDGGRLWLNTATAVNLDYSPQQRRLELLAGEVYIETAADPRPLRVETPFGSAVPLGTAFRVRLRDRDVRVEVSAGRVALTPREPAGTGPAAANIVEAGQARSFDGSRVSPATAAEAQGAAWRRRILVADNRPLGEFLDELGRYRTGVIRYDQRAARLKLVGAFPLDDTDRVLAALEDSLPLKVRRLTPWWVRVEGL